MSTRIAWNKAAFMTLETPSSFPSNTREDPNTHTGLSTMLHSWEERRQAAKAARRQVAEAKRRIGVRTFSWEEGQ